MKAYGVDKRDADCCPGHDKYPPEPYGITSRKSYRRADRHRKTKARMKAKKALRQILRGL